MWAAVLALAAASPAALPADKTPVASMIEKLDIDCWQSDCGTVALSCADKDPLCMQRLKCEAPWPLQSGGTDMRRESFQYCYKGVSFAELRPGERALFKCAHQKGCILPAVPPDAVAGVSLIEDFKEPDVKAGEHGATAQGVDMRAFLFALQELESQRLERIQVEAQSEAQAKQKIAEAAGALEKLHEGGAASVPLEEMDQLDQNLGKVQADLDKHELESRESLAAPPLGMVLAALNAPKEPAPSGAVETERDGDYPKAKAPAQPSSFLEYHRRHSPVLGSKADLEATPALGMGESLAQFVEGLGGDTPALLKLAEQQRKRDMAPLARERAHAFEKSYIEESQRLGQPVTPAQAAAALRAGRSSLVEGGPASPGAKAIEATMAKLAAFNQQMKADFGQVDRALDHHLRQDAQ